MRHKVRGNLSSPFVVGDLSPNFNIITIEPNKRSGKPCIRGLRITVYDVLENDIKACLAFAAARERKLFVAPIIAADGFPFKTGHPF
jgi:uncharacterized protein (DUF433 family)